jgi:hypothetical protein
LECIRDPEKITDKIVKQQVLKYMSLDDDLYQRTTDDVLLKCLGEEQAKVAVWKSMMEFVEHTSRHTR